jgi:single-strand DNA-binding protein
MNKVNLIGRITRDLDLKGSEAKYIKFNLAVPRQFKNQNGERETDFISCVAWRKTAELIAQYFKKGSQIGISGRIQTGSYDKEDGTKVYTTDVIVEDITFIDKKQDTQSSTNEFEDFGNVVEEVELDDSFLD